MTLIDTHTHLYDEAFDADRRAAVGRALEAGVTKMLLPNINPDTVEPMLAMCREWPGTFYPLIGLHPEDVRDDWADVLAGMFPGEGGSGEAACGPYVGIGEVGLDFYWDTTYRLQQLEAFDWQVRRAVACGLPLVIHQRAAFGELLDVMQLYRTDCPTGIFHCFGGTAEEAEALLAFDGFMLGIGGTVTYKKSTLPDVLRSVVPVSRIVVETDSPYLAPVPHRGQRNETSYIVDTTKKLADIYGLPADEMAAITTANAQRVFPCLR